jgi:hypothetical protein
MAIRKRLSHPEKVRERIRTSQLVNRLTGHVLGKVEMSQTQVSAALGLLRKTLADKSEVEHSGETAHTIAWNPIAESEWEETYGVGSSAGSADSAH